MNGTEYPGSAFPSNGATLSFFHATHICLVLACNKWFREYKNKF